MSEHHPTPAPAPSPVSIEGRSDRENLLILFLVAVGLLYLLVRTSELKPAPAGPQSGRGGNPRLNR